MTKNDPASHALTDAGGVPRSALDLLTTAYGAIRDAWAALLVDENCDDAAPWGAVTLADTDPDEVGVLLTVAEISASHAAVSVLQHLRLLALAYPPEALTDAGLDPAGWPGLASFSTTRSLLEAAALTSWSLTPDITERLRRSAQFQIWSANEGRKSGTGPTAGSPGSVDVVRPIVERAGFEVREIGRRQDLVVVLEGQPKPFYISGAVSHCLGPAGRKLYNGWSGITHHVSWAVSPWAVLTAHDDDPGMYHSALTFEDKHVELAADVAAVVLIAGQSVGAFYGRDLHEFTATCQQAESELRQAIPEIRQALGRPDADPT